MSGKKRFLQIVISAAGALFFIWFLLPVFTGGVLNLGNILGLSGFGAIALYGIFSTRVNVFIKKICLNKKIKALLIFLCIFAAACLGVAAAVSADMVKSANQLPTESSTLVVLGCRVYGERPSRMLTQRMNRAYEYMRENPDINCVLSGGQGEGEDISEAECMYRYLTQRGIAPERLFKEDKSTSTRENLRFSAELIKKQNLPRSITIVTHEFHMLRARIIAEKLGIKAFALSTPTSWWLLPTYWVRDVCGVIAERCSTVLRK